ncbi:MAG: sensor domain-containing diguanylate cyclase [Deltaproteobacteria bacterium]|nr:sensor domain-containing diguanylate cyclase [Deltaproteobacteria bacterium]
MESTNDKTPHHDSRTGELENRQRLAQLAAFNEIGKALASSLDLREILGIVMDKISVLLQPKNWSLLLLDDKTNELYFEIIIGKGAEKIKDIRLKLGEGIAGWVAREMKPLLVADVSKDPRFSKKADDASKFTTRSIVCVPLANRGRCHGVIELINKVEDGRFGEEDLVLLTTLADYTAIAIENAKFFNKVQELTITDDLTKLYNSRFMHDRLDYEFERAKRAGTNLSVIFIDLDHFKDINDRHGHLNGSKLLAEVAHVFVSMIRAVDMACRYGGDEFLILMPDTSKPNAMTAAGKLCRALRETVMLKDEGLNIKITGSFGVASYPVDATSKTDIIHQADNAMYRAKDRGRDAVTSA